MQTNTSLTPNELFGHYRPWAAGIARSVHRRLPPSFELDDLVQAAEMAMWQAAQKYKPTKGVEFRCYAHAAVNGACYMLARRRNYIEATHEELHEPAVDGPERRVMNWQRAKRAFAQMEDLPALERQVLRLHYEDSLPMTTVAARVNRGLTTVYTLRAKALRALHMLMIQNELDGIVQRINYHEKQAQQSAKLAIQYKLQIGEELLKAKRLLPHGEFGRWAQNEFGWGPRHTQNHMRLARNAQHVSQLPSGASLRMALAAIAAPSNGKTVVVVEQTGPGRYRLIGEVETKRVKPSLKQLVAGCHKWTTRRIGAIHQREAAPGS